MIQYSVPHNPHSADADWERAMLDALERFDRENPQPTARQRPTPPLQNAPVEGANRRMDFTDWPEAPADRKSVV